MRETKEAVLVIVVTNKAGHPVGRIEKRVAMPVDVLSERRPIECYVTEKIRIESDFVYGGYGVDEGVERYILSGRINICGDQAIREKLCNEAKAKGWQWREGKIDAAHEQGEICIGDPLPQLTGRAFVFIVLLAVTLALSWEYLGPSLR